jgi:ABC-type oligopeptide transport system ATPase subunit
VDLKVFKPKKKFSDVFKHYPILGAKDALSLSAIGAGLMMTNPVFMGSATALGVAMASTLIGTLGIFNLRAKHAYDEVDMDSRKDFVLPSDEVPVIKNEDGILLGYTTDKYLPLMLPYELFMRHLAIVGASGVGKTTLGILMLWQQMAKGGGFVFIDAKVDKDTKDGLGYLAKSLGRDRDYYVLNVDDPENSNTYNPLLNGDPDEVASRLLNLIPATESNPGADHYRQLANHALTAVIGGLKAAKLRYHFDDLITVFQSAAAMQELVNKVPAGTKEKKNLEIFLDKYRKLERGQAVIDIAKIKTEIGGLAGRMAQFSQGKFGEIFNTYTPEIDLFDIIKNNKMLYIMLPTMGKGTAALNLAKMILSDFMSAVYQIQALPKNERPWPPCHAFFDEFGRYAIAESAILIEQARSAHIGIMPGFQGYGNLADVSDSFADMVLQSTWTKAMFRFGSDESAERSADIIGKIKRYQQTLTDSDSSSDGAQLLQYAPQSTEGDGEATGQSWREIEEHRVSIDKLTSLKIGQAIFTIGGEVYHVKIPRITTPIDDEKKGQKRKPEHVFKPYRRRIKIPYGEKGLGIAENYKKFLLENSEEAESQRRRGEARKKKGPNNNAKDGRKNNPDTGEDE